MSIKTFFILEGKINLYQVIKPFQIPIYKNTFAKFDRKKSEANKRKCI